MGSKIQTANLKSTSVRTLDRIIGSIEGAADGPTIIVLAGMHGNELSGVEALENAFNILKNAEIDFCGKFLGIRANLPALENEPDLVSFYY